MTDITLPRSVVEQALEAHRALRDWMHAVPQTVVLPAMPGVDGDWLDDVESTLHTALEQPQDHPEQHLNMVPAGWKLVPVEPTEEMLRSSCGCESPSMFRESLRRETDGRLTAEMVEKIIRRHLASYRVMLAAAPQPPVVEQPQSVTDCHQSQPQVEQETVGEAGSMPGTDGFTMACFRASDVPVGTKLYTHPQPKGEQEPVAYYVMNGAALFQLFRSKSQADALAYDLQKRHDLSGSLAHFHVVPLYIRPQPPRQPLTDAQINDHRLALPYDGEDLPDPWDFKQGVRAAERAHRIGGEA